MNNHTHTRLMPGKGCFTCIICGEQCDPRREAWTLLKYNIDDRGLGVYSDRRRRRAVKANDHR